MWERERKVLEKRTGEQEVSKGRIQKRVPDSNQKTLSFSIPMSSVQKNQYFEEIREGTQTPVD